jgi:hypothetical protein
MSVIGLCQTVLYWFMVPDAQYLLVGSEDGNFSIATDPGTRQSALVAAMERMPLLG